MHVDAWATEFLRAQRRDVHEPLREPWRYGEWWPGVSSLSAGAQAALTLRPPGLFRAAQRLLVAVLEDRPDLGVLMRYRGDIDGEAEWYYLDEANGVVVHYLLRAELPDRGWRRCLAAHRAAVRLALHTLKDGLEGQRLPGDEPAPGLRGRAPGRSDHCGDAGSM